MFVGIQVAARFGSNRLALQTLMQQILSCEEYRSTNSAKTRCGGEDHYRWKFPVKTGTLKMGFI